MRHLFGNLHEARVEYGTGALRHGYLEVEIARTNVTWLSRALHDVHN
jgi:hypothetical protein